jgi:hypothetical protein
MKKQQSNSGKEQIADLRKKWEIATNTGIDISDMLLEERKKNARLREALKHPDIENMLDCECGYYDETEENPSGMHKCLKCTLQEAVKESTNG